MLKAAIWPLDATVNADDLTVHLLSLEDAGFCTIGTDENGQLSYRLSEAYRAAEYQATSGPRYHFETHRAGRREEEGAGGAGPAPQPPRLPAEVYLAELGPVPWCPDHPGNSLEECGPCGGQREYANRWRKERQLERRIARQSRRGTQP